METSDVISIITCIISVIASIISVLAANKVVKFKNQEIRGKDIRNNNITIVGGDHNS